MPQSPRTTEALTAVIATAQLGLLREHDFPSCERIVAAARSAPDGVHLSGTRHELETLLGWVAGEANHLRRRRRTRDAEVWDELADILDLVLGNR